MTPYLHFTAALRRVRFSGRFLRECPLKRTLQNARIAHARRAFFTGLISRNAPPKRKSSNAPTPARACAALIALVAAPGRSGGSPASAGADALVDASRGGALAAACGTILSKINFSS